MKRARPILLGTLVVALVLLPGRVCFPRTTTHHAEITLEPVGTYATGQFDESAAETVSYDPGTQRLFVSNAAGCRIDVLDISDPADPKPAAGVHPIDLSAYGAEPTHVEVHGGLVAVSMKADPVTDPGQLVLLDADGVVIDSFVVGSLPDSLRFTPDGKKVVVANEGEPNDEYTVDPEGSLSIIDIEAGAVCTADFRSFNPLKDHLLKRWVRIYGPGATVAQDLEPEDLTISEDSKTAWVTLQENNALAIVDLERAEVLDVVSFGFKFHYLPGNGLDASNKDDAINIFEWPVMGMYQPDGIASFRVGGVTHIITANEGDARDYDGYSEEARVKDLAPREDEDPVGYLGNALRPFLPTIWPTIQENENLGRLKITTAPPAGKRTMPCGTEVYQLLFSYGARSFSIWTASGSQVFDSGDDFEQIIARMVPDYFNTTDGKTKFDSRSDDKGPEPEDVVVGEVGGRTYAFITLERMGGVMIYDVSDPRRPVFNDYVNNRDFEADPESPEAGDLGPEGMVFISTADSPIGEPLLVVANEVSGTTTIFKIVPF